MSIRLLIGLGIGSGFEAADAVAVRADGFGLGITPRVVGVARVPFAADVRDAGRELAQRAGAWPAGFARSVGEGLAAATRQAAERGHADLRTALAAGLITPLTATSPDPLRPAAAPADWVAERTGLTVVTGFAGRDVAAGGGGHLPTPAADFLLFRDPVEERLLIHLGAVTTAVLLPASDKITSVIGFECGPGTRLLDDLTALGTRGREATDSGGTKAVQGRCDDVLLDRWLAQPFLARRPTRPVPRSAFGTAFLTAAFDATRDRGGTLHDLLCTATHFVARCVATACARWLPPPAAPRRIVVGGGGGRNGFLWKLLAAQFPDRLDRFDGLGVPASARRAAAAAVLAGLTLDGVSGNLPLVTGASGGRLVGRLVPGDPRNWAACVAWMADRLADYPALGRAA